MSVPLFKTTFYGAIDGRTKPLFINFGYSTGPAIAGIYLFLLESARLLGCADLYYNFNANN